MTSVKLQTSKSKAFEGFCHGFMLKKLKELQFDVVDRKPSTTIGNSRIHVNLQKKKCDLQTKLEQFYRSKLSLTFGLGNEDSTSIESTHKYIQNILTKYDKNGKIDINDVKKHRIFGTNNEYFCETDSVFYLTDSINVNLSQLKSKTEEANYYWHLPDLDEMKSGINNYNDSDSKSDISENALSPDAKYYALFEVCYMESSHKYTGFIMKCLQIDKKLACYAIRYMDKHKSNVYNDNNGNETFETAFTRAIETCIGMAGITINKFISSKECKDIINSLKCILPCLSIYLCKRPFVVTMIDDNVTVKEASKALTTNDRGSILKDSLQLFQNNQESALFKLEESFEKRIAEKDKIIKEKDEIIKEKDKKMEEKDKKMEEIRNKNEQEKMSLVVNYEREKSGLKIKHAQTITDLRKNIENLTVQLRKAERIKVKSVKTREKYQEMSDKMKEKASVINEREITLNREKEEIKARRQQSENELKQRENELKQRENELKQRANKLKEKENELISKEERMKEEIKNLKEKVTTTEENHRAAFNAKHKVEKDIQQLEQRFNLLFFSFIWLIATYVVSCFI